ncbi:Oxidoreductase NAD-binding domain-containing protein 1 [Sporothrix epigloea]|uniref:Oxidoreductase NAD-binding domain-containing protein 1 n=1 Tax=Sporothrix epigloea TaxID=1892477 RepID=A0ABP0E2T0_9PEZI
MSDVKESHEERTANEPRETSLPGQWVDAFCPGIAKAGGFTITSTPSKATSASSERYIELAVKRSLDNPAAAWLWRDKQRILGQTLQVRIGGSFVFPSPKAPSAFVKDRSVRVVFVAGGVGINPLISMATYLGELNKARSDAGEPDDAGCEVIFLHSVQINRTSSPEDGGDDDSNDEITQIPFLPRLAALYGSKAIRGHLKVFLTSSNRSCDVLSCNGEDVPCMRRRITTADLDAAVLGGSAGDSRELASTYVYLCGVPAMTDLFTQHLTSKEGLGLAADTVWCEKWW